MELSFIMRTEKKPQGEGFKNLLGNLILIFKILTLVQLVTGTCIVTNKLQLKGD